MRFPLVLAIAVLGCTSVLAQTAPTITSLSPTVGPVSPVGSSVTINGANFGGTQGGSSVTFAGIAAAPTSWSSTKIIVPVPTAAPVGFNDVVVTVNTLSSNARSFLVIPTITSLSTGRATIGTSITLTGTSFGAQQGSSTVSLNGTPAVPTSWNDASITVPVPIGASDGPVVVTVNGFETNGVPFLIVPNISALSPGVAAVGALVAIQGSGFGTSPGFGGVTFNGLTATVQTWSSTSISVIVPQGATTGDVVVTDSSLVASSGTLFFVIPPPSVGSLVPASGAIGSMIIILGSHFGPDQGTVTFNGSAAPVASWADSSITASVPAGASSGAVVVNTAGRIPSLGVQFTVVSPPVITALTPGNGSIGTQVTLAGSDFGANQGNGLVQIGNQAMIVHSWSNTSVVATVPAEAMSGNVVLTAAGGIASNAQPFTVNFGGPVLQFVVVDAPTQVNLTSAQNLDWIHWGRISPTFPDRKAGIAPLISDYTAINGAQPSTSLSSSIAFSWTDGNHPQVVSETTADIEAPVTGTGFQISVPADTEVKTLNLYVEVFHGKGQLQASLSDGSAAAISDQSVADPDLGTKIYSIDFRAASAGQTLTVTFKSISGSVGLQAATLTPHLPVLAITSPAAGLMFPAPASIPLAAVASQFDSSIAGVQAMGSEGTFLQSTSSPLNATWGPLPAGHYSVTATAIDSAGLTNTSSPQETDVIGQGGSLSIQESLPSSPIDLDVQGTGDWVLWGPLNNGGLLINNPRNVLARKAGVAPLISDYKLIGNHIIHASAGAHTLTFTAASQNLTATGSDVAVFGLHDGFEITAPADTTSRTLQLYVGVISGDLNLTGFLSDGSAAVATEVGGTGPPAPTTTVYTVNYSAASSGQTLTLRLTLGSDQGGGEAVLIGAALGGPSAAPAAPAPHITSINPASAPTNTQVTISGTNFGTTQGKGGVTFGKIDATIATWSDTAITAIVPAAFSDGATVPVAVSTSAGFSNQLGLTIPSYKVVPSSISMVVGQSAVVSPQDSHGTTITGLAWSAKDLGVVSFSIDDPPVITALAAGTTTVYAGDVPMAVTVYSVAPPLVSISIGPQSTQVALGLNQQFSAIGTYADGSSQDVTANVTWTSQSPSIATINSAGLASSIQVGTVTIQASVGSVRASATLAVQPPLLKSLSIAPAAPGTTAGATQAFTATGVYTDGATHDVTASVTWNSSSPSVATIDATGLARGTGPGHTLISATQGTIANAVTLTVTANATPPSITAQVSPSPNSLGWSNLNTTVTYTCTPGSSPIVTCPPPQIISTEGAGQLFSGTVTDAAGNTASASVTLKVDKTKPALAIASPTNGAVLSTAALTITGTTTDTLSGLRSVTCNDSFATLSGANFSCNVVLNPGLNLLVVRAADTAGNVAASVMHITFNTPLPSPQSLQITPSAVNMLVGNTQRFTAVDEHGRPRADATWTISDNSLATISTDASPILTAIALGQPILTATVGPVSAQLQVHIFLPVAPLPVGTPRWSIPESAGFDPLSTIRAQPVEGAPDLYSLEVDGSGNLNVRALTGEGLQLWSAQLEGPPQATIVAAGDANGGMLLTIGGGFGHSGDSMIDLDAQTGAILWEYDLTGLTILNPTQPAIASDGTLYFWQQEGEFGSSTNPFRAYLVALDGIAGTPIARYPIPNGTEAIDDGSVFPQFQPTVTDAVIDSNGTVWAGYTVTNTTPESSEESLSLLEVSPGGGASSVTFQTLTGNDPTQGPFGGPFQVIPNGQGGVLVSWESTLFIPNNSQSTFHVSNVSSGGGSTDFTFSSFMNKMVLGENGAAYADNFGGVTAFDIYSGATLWTYSQPLNIVGALSDGRLIVNTAVDGLVTLDSSGALIASLGSPVPSVTPWSLGDWAGVLNGSFALFPGPTTDFATNESPLVYGNPQKQHHQESPHPVKFRVLNVEAEDNGVIPRIHHLIAWDSSTGKPLDLKGCQVREHVTYSGDGSDASCIVDPSKTCFYGISPPWPAKSSLSQFPNPTDVKNDALSMIPGSSPPQLGGQDDIKTPDPRFVKPYSKSSFTATQVEQYQCPGMGEKWVDFSEPYTVVRTLMRDPSGQWITTLTKTGPGINVTSKGTLLIQ